MKKVLVFLFSLLMVISMVACSNQNGDEPTIDEPIIPGVANPMVEYTSLEEINKKIGSNIQKIGAMGVTDEKYYVISDEIAEYDFSIGGYEYTVRASLMIYNDISGIYGENGLILQDYADLPAFGSTDEYKALQYVFNKVKYCFIVKDNGKLSEIDAVNNFDEMIDSIVGEVSESVDSVCGSYIDTTSNIAALDINPYSKDEIIMAIYWEKEDNQYDLWKIVGKVSEGKIDYSDIQHYFFDGTEMLVANDAMPGYFEIDNGAIKWTGSKIKATQDCVFVEADY